MGDYRKLKVWHRARALSNRIPVLLEALPPTERARVGDQLSRAADSIRFTIVEGTGFNSDPQLAKYLTMSLSSANEVQDELDSVMEHGELPSEFADMPGEVTEIRAMIAVLQRKVAGDAKRRKKRKP